MAAEWYYAKGKQKHGPLTEAQLQELAASGELLPSDMVWRKGTKGWVEASTMPGLFPDDGPPPLEESPADEQIPPLQAVWRFCTTHPVLCAAGGLGVCFLLTLIVPTAFASLGLDGLAALFGVPLILADLALLVLLVVLGIRHLNHYLSYAILAGKWNPVDGRGEPLEFSGMNTVTRGNSLAGTYVVHKDKSMEVVSGGQVVEVWQLVKVDGSELVIRDASGVIKRFKKKPSNLFAALFDSKRTNHLEGSWQPITEANEWVQFTKDGAVVFSDGTAGRYTVVGEEPNEIIEMEMVDGVSRQFKIVSLTPSQLVIAEGNEATTFRRPKTGSGKRRNVQASQGADSTEVEAGGAEEGGTSSKGFMGSIFSFFFRYKCPKCGHRSGKKQSSRIVGHKQEVRSLPEGSLSSPVMVQRVVDLTLWEYDVKCQDCNHQWCERSVTMSKA